MNYDDIENLVVLAKLGDKSAKEELVAEFSPLISNLSKKSFINSYEFSDIKNECYKTLFKCVIVYNSDRHCFVGYATNAIKNSVNNLIKTSVRRESSEGKSALILDGDLENSLCSDMEDLDNHVLSKLNKTNLKPAMEILTFIEKELVNYVFFQKYSFKNYAKFKGIPYDAVIYRKKIMLKKLRTALETQHDNSYLN